MLHACADSAPVAVLQAVARGLPVVLTPTTGWARAVERHGCGVVWDGGTPLLDALRAAVATPVEARQAFTAEFADDVQRRALLAAYGEILAARVQATGPLS